MSYNSLAQLHDDTNFRLRCTGCAAEQKIQASAVLDPSDPQDWVNAHAWELAAAPGFAAAFESALETGVPNPGLDPSVISDGQILAAVQALLA